MNSIPRTREEISLAFAAVTALPSTADQVMRLRFLMERADHLGFVSSSYWTVLGSTLGDHTYVMLEHSNPTILADPIEFPAPIDRTHLLEAMVDAQDVHERRLELDVAFGIDSFVRRSSFLQSMIEWFEKPSRRRPLPSLAHWTVHESNGLNWTLVSDVLPEGDRRARAVISAIAAAAHDYTDARAKEIAESHRDLIALSSDSSDTREMFEFLRSEERRFEADKRGLTQKLKSDPIAAVKELLAGIRGGKKSVFDELASGMPDGEMADVRAKYSTFCAIVSLQVDLPMPAVADCGTAECLERLEAWLCEVLPALEEKKGTDQLAESPPSGGGCDAAQPTPEPTSTLPPSERGEVSLNELEVADRPTRLQKRLGLAWKVERVEQLISAVKSSDTIWFGSKELKEIGVAPTTVSGDFNRNVASNPLQSTAWRRGGGPHNDDKLYHRDYLVEYFYQRYSPRTQLAGAANSACDANDASVCAPDT